MEPEVKDIIFDTNLKQIQQEMKDTANVAKMMGKTFKENSSMNFSPEETKVIEKYKDTLEDMMKFSTSSGTNLTKVIDGFKLTSFADGTATIEKVGEAAEEAGDKVEDIGKKVQVSFKGGIKQLTKFTLGLIGIRSVWTILTRASQQYMSENKEINESLKLTFSIMANLIGPAIKSLVSIVEYAAIIIAKMVQTLTGVDVISKVSANALKNLGKEAKKTHNALASFDTISNLSQNENAMESYKAMLEAYNDFQDKVGEIEEFWNKWGKWVTAAVGSLSLLWGANVIEGLAKVIGVKGVAGAAGKGLAGIASLLGWIAALTVLTIEIKLIMDGIEYWNQFKKDMEEHGKEMQGNNKLHSQNIQKVVDKYIELAKKENKTKEEEQQLILVRNTLLEQTEDLTYSYKGEWDQLENLIKSTGPWSKATKEQVGVLETLSNKSLAQVQALEKLATETDLSTEEAKSYIKEIEKQIALATGNANAIKTMGGNYEAATKNIDDMRTSLGKIKSKYEAEVKIKANTKDAEKSMSNFITKVLNSGLGNIPVFSSIKNLFKYDVGTNYVPQDQIAVVHKGEMIVPKKYNPMTSGIGGSSEETNELLRQLNTTLENKQFNGYISASDITNTAIQGINQQSRAMGRSVIR